MSEPYVKLDVLGGWVIAKNLHGRIIYLTEDGKWVGDGRGKRYNTRELAEAHGMGFGVLPMDFTREAKLVAEYEALYQRITKLIEAKAFPHIDRLILAAGREAAVAFATTIPESVMRAFGIDRAKHHDPA